MIMASECPGDDRPFQDLSDLTALDIESADTVLMLVGDDRIFSVTGTFIEVTENTIVNSGAIIDTFFLDTYSEYYLGQVHAVNLNWYSSNTFAATVSDGKVSAKSPGNTFIWAESEQITSDSVYIQISGIDQQPKLVLEPPPIQLIFQDTSNVKGNVTPGMDLMLTINDSAIDHDTEGNIFVPVELDTGINHFSVKAVNNVNGLFDEKEKTIIYYPFDMSGIEGNWAGETLGRPFSFEIYNYMGIYVIDGTLTVDVTMLGGPLVVENIVIYGLIRSDGTIDVEASLDESGVSVTGSMDGYFLNSGLSEGHYSLKVSVDGVASVRTGAVWTAERISD